MLPCSIALVRGKTYFTFNLRFNLKIVMSNPQNDCLNDARRKEKAQDCDRIQLFYSIKPLD